MSACNNIKIDFVIMWEVPNWLLYYPPRLLICPWILRRNIGNVHWIMNCLLVPGEIPCRGNVTSIIAAMRIPTCCWLFVLIEVGIDVEWARASVSWLVSMLEDFSCATTDIAIWPVKWSRIQLSSVSIFVLYINSILIRWGGLGCGKKCEGDHYCNRIS